MAIKILRPLKAIRQKCLECSAGSKYEVRMCPCVNCPLFPYRFGKRPTLDIKKQLLAAKSLPLLHKEGKSKPNYEGDEVKNGKEETKD